MAQARARAEPPFAVLAELFPPQSTWTEAHYFSLPDTNRLVELAEGQILMPPHPTRSHQNAVQELYLRLRTHVDEREVGEVYVAPLPVRLAADRVREPDVLFMATEHADRMGEQFFGPPDLVMEVTSPGTRRTDRTEKLLEYAQAEVSEYWIADPQARTVEVFVLQGESYELLGRWGVGETARSSLLPGFEVDVADLFR